MHAPAKYFEKWLAIAANGAWAVFSRINRVRPAQSFTPRWSDKAAAEILGEDQAHARLATPDRLTLPGLRARGPTGDS